MSLYAWTQDLPISADIYNEIATRMADSPMPGLVTHVAIELDNGLMRYVDVWDSQASCDAAFAAVIHPAVHPVLMARQVKVDREPERVAVKVIDVRFSDGRSVRA